MDHLPRKISTEDALTSLASHLMETQEYSADKAVADALSILGFAEAVDVEGIADRVIEELS